MKLDQFKDWGEAYSEDPKLELWANIESNLDRNEKVSTFNFRNWAMAIAAVAVIVVSTTLIFNVDKHKESESTFAYNLNQKPILLEELNFSDPAIQYYSAPKIEALSEAYARLNF